MLVEPNLTDPNLLSAGPRHRAITIFLCGPGFSHHYFELRKFVKDYFESFINIDVTLGEHVPDKLSLPARTPRDLQTLESFYAHLVDFTVLLLESPGSIAELGTFSMIPNVRPRLFAVLASDYYNAESYISRGPLSLLASHNQNNVIYYNSKNRDSLKRRLNYPISLYKHSSFFGGYQYQRNAKFNYRSFRKPSVPYWDTVAPLYHEFLQSLVLSSINILQEPTFSDLVRHLHLSPKDLTDSLRELFKKGRIKKGANGKYSALQGFQDSQLQGFSSTRLSRRRAEILAG